MFIFRRWSSTEIGIINEIKTKLYFHIFILHELTIKLPQVQDKMNVNLIKRFVD